MSWPTYGRLCHMYTRDPQSVGSFPKLVGLLAASIFILLLFVWLPQPARPFISPWRAMSAAQPVLAAASEQPDPAATIVVRGQAIPDPSVLESYNQGSALQDADPSGRVRFYRRDVAGGSIAY